MLIRTLLVSLVLVASGSATAASGVYKVARGDTLYGIANRYHTTVASLLSHNGLSSNQIYVGQELQIPGAGSDILADTQTQLSYTVRRGDSLSVIASRFNVSLDTLRSANRIRGNLLHPGQVLFIPGKAAYDQPKINKPTALVHVVRKGDSLWEISKRYRISVSSLTLYNGISKRAALIPGQKIRIPADTSLPSVESYLATGAKDPGLGSQSVMIVDASSGKPLYMKNADTIRSIASITKLMTAMVTLDANLSMDETLTIDDNDVDRLKFTSSRLPLGTKLSRREMLHIALMSSENRAASALSRHYPGGRTAFLAAMNAKAKNLGMANTFFADATGLNPRNVSTASDLAKMVAAASQYETIHNFTTDDGEQINTGRGILQYRNTNPLVRSGELGVQISKTGYINEAGRCLVMKSEIGARPAYLVFLRGNNRSVPIADAKRVTRWIESGDAGINLAGL